MMVKVKVYSEAPPLHCWTQVIRRHANTHSVADTQNARDLQVSRCCEFCRAIVTDFKCFSNACLHVNALLTAELASYK